MIISQVISFGDGVEHPLHPGFMSNNWGQQLQ